MPVEIINVKGENDFIRLMIESNRQRVKTNEEIASEARELMRLAKEEAKERRRESGDQHGKGQKGPENKGEIDPGTGTGTYSGESSAGDARDVVARAAPGSRRAGTVVAR